MANNLFLHNHFEMGIKQKGTFQDHKSRMAGSHKPSLKIPTDKPPPHPSNHPEHHQQSPCTSSPDSNHHRQRTLIGRAGTDHAGNVFAAEGHRLRERRTKDTRPTPFCPAYAIYYPRHPSMVSIWPYRLSNCAGH